MGNLRHLYRWNFVAKQIGWKRAPSIDLPPTASNRAPLVARRHAYRLQWCETGGTLQDLRYPCRRRSPGATLVRGERTGSNLVQRWKRAHVRSIADGRPKSAKVMLLDLKKHALTQVGGSQGICCPRWSPDGRYVVALSADNQKLLLLDLSTQKWRQLADKMGILGYMTWSKDSKYIGFDTSFTADPGFFRVRVADGQIGRVVSLKNIRRFCPQRGDWRGMAQDGSPLVVRDISTQEIYALDWQLP